MSKKVLVIGAGAWGTALANHLSKLSCSVTIWGRDLDVIKQINEEGVNNKYLPTLNLERGLLATSSLYDNFISSEYIVFALPSAASPIVVKELSDQVKKNNHQVNNKLIINVSKGFAFNNSCLNDSSSSSLGRDLSQSENNFSTSDYSYMTELLKNNFSAEVGVLSGPGFAKELVQGRYTAVTIAAEKEEISQKISELFHGANLRTYSSVDLVGVELGGILKNIIAIAIGIVDGAELGDNARAALLTRSLVELRRFIKAFGGLEDTVFGLSGLGDLYLTSTSDSSRNRRFGVRLGRGEDLDIILKEIGTVEGARNAMIAAKLAESKNIEIPIISTVSMIISKEISVDQACKRLFFRERKRE